METNITPSLKPLSSISTAAAKAYRKKLAEKLINFDFLQLSHPNEHTMGGNDSQQACM